jgi:hypothetical protein
MYKYGPIEETMTLLEAEKKKENEWTLDNYFIQFSYHNSMTGKEQSHKEINPLFQILYDARSRDTCAGNPAFTCVHSTH